MPSKSSVQWLWRHVGPLDLMWLLLFWILGAVNHTWRSSEVLLLIALSMLQVIEMMRVPPALTRATFLWNTLKLLLCYLLIGFTGGIASSYYILLLLPILSAAMTLKPFVTFAFTVLTIASYLSFLIFVDWSAYSLAPQAIRNLILRSITLTVMACVMSVTVKRHITT